MCWSNKRGKQNKKREKKNKREKEKKKKATSRYDVTSAIEFLFCFVLFFFCGGLAGILYKS